MTRTPRRRRRGAGAGQGAQAERRRRPAERRAAPAYRGCRRCRREPSTLPPRELAARCRTRSTRSRPQSRRLAARAALFRQPSGRRRHRHRSSPGRGRGAGAADAARATIPTSSDPRCAPRSRTARTTGRTRRRDHRAKGEVTGAGQRPKTPAERLGLDAKQRAKAEKCLAEAVYFESRGEAKRGQIAVAQVVMNRVFSGFYPNNVCGVVYQNAHRNLACQFTFACDGIPDVVNEPRHVGAGQGDRPRHARRQAVAAGDRQLDALPRLLGASVRGCATMRKLHKIGVHSFYRPRALGRRLGRAEAFVPGITPRARRSYRSRVVGHDAITSRYRAPRRAPAPNA